MQSPTEPTPRKDTRFKPGNTFGLDTRFKPENSARLVHGRYSEQMRMALQQARTEMAQEVAADYCARQGFDVTPMQRTLIGRYVELDGLATTLFDQLLEHGPLTQTGKARKLFAHYCAIVDKQTKVAQALGLPKPPRELLPKVPPVSMRDYRPADEDPA